jgi:hypothetical protein
MSLSSSGGIGSSLREDGGAGVVWTWSDMTLIALGPTNTSWPVTSQYATQANVPVHEGQPIADSIKTFLAPAIPPLERSLAAGDWAAAARGYATLVESCNGCHVQTRHEFIVVLPASGEPPHGQKFAP